MLTNKRILVAATIGLAFGLPGFCQTSIDSVRVYTEPAGVFFQVDDQSYRTAAEFLWPAGSKHRVTSYNQDAAQWKTRHVYKGWVTNLSPTAQPSDQQPITAGAGLKWIKLVFETSYAITITLHPCPKTGDPYSAPGRVEIVGEGVFDCDSEIYLPADTEVIARAYPNNGFVFLNWGAAARVANPAAFDIRFLLDAARSLNPQFQTAAAVQVNVAIGTDPPGLQIFADRSPYVAPAKLEWAWNSVHSIGAPEQQLLHGVPYVFSSWSDGGAINHDIVVPSQSAPLNLTARFVRGASVSFATSPAGLKLSIDGSQSWQAYNFMWAPGSSHNVSAPKTQTDAAGRKFEFVSWTGGRPASFAYIAGEAASADHLTAVYRAIGQITIVSNPEGISIGVDGDACVTPCAIERPLGAEVQLTAPEAQESGDGVRLLFAGWRDAKSPARVVTAGLDRTTYTAEFRRQFRLSLSCDPRGGAVIQAAPHSPDGFYDDGTPVTVSATLRAGFRLLGWSGDLSGRSSSSVLLLDSSKSAVLQLEPIPAITQSGVRNAASNAPDGSVAPGSLISIYGVHLAPELLTSAANPLAQTLAGVTVRVNGSFLPLYFVSPEQINAQLVSGLEPGRHTLIVRVEGEPETAVEFEVARNAPGLFSGIVNGVSVGLVVREGGETVTTENPARPGEVLTILGTGLGPYRRTPPDGFVLEESPEYTLVDAVEIVAGGVRLPALYAGRTTAGVGVDAVRFVLPANLATSPFVQIRIEVNQTESNVVSLPVTGGSDPTRAANPEK